MALEDQPWVCLLFVLFLLHLQTQPSEYDFKGGAGSESVSKPGIHKSAAKTPESQSPEPDLEDDLSEEIRKMKEPMEVTPVRQSARTAQKKFKYSVCHYL